MKRFGLNVLGPGASGCRAALVAAIAAMSAALTPPVLADAAALSPYVSKPGTWTTMIIPNEGAAITDAQFAEWMKAAQVAADSQEFGPDGARGARQLTLVAEFTQCFSGGFLAELKNKEFKGFGATSSCKYFQSAYYEALDSHSFFAKAWREAAEANPAGKDDKVALQAWNKLLATPGGAGVPRFDYLAEVQYLNSTGGASTLGISDKGIAIIFAGMPEKADQNDVGKVLKLLTDPANRGGMGFKRADVKVLYGDGKAIEGLGWKPDAAATSDTLRKTITAETTGTGGFVLPKLAGAAPDAKVQLFLWVADHGNARAPFSITTSPRSKGTAGDVKARAAAGKKVENVVYEAGVQTNKEHFILEKANPKRESDVRLSDNPEIIAISFANDIPAFQGSQTPRFSLYFNVDRFAQGSRFSSVENERMKTSACSDVFIATGLSNRQMMPGPEMGLRKDKMAAKQDDAVGLTDKSISTVIPPRDDKRALKAPLFFVVKEQPNTIFVYDPMRNSIYPWYTWPAWVKPDGRPGLPTDMDVQRSPTAIDGLALDTQLIRKSDREEGDPEDRPTRLVPDFMHPLIPEAARKDKIMFSVPPGMNVFRPMKPGPIPGAPPMDLVPLPAACDVWLFPTRMSDIKPFDRYMQCAESGLIERGAIAGEMLADTSDNMLDFALAGTQGPGGTIRDRYQEAPEGQADGMIGFSLNRDAAFNVIVTIIAHWGTSIGDANYDFDADINSDGMIDLADIGLVLPMLPASNSSLGEQESGALPTSTRR